MIGVIYMKKEVLFYFILFFLVSCVPEVIEEPVVEEESLVDEPTTPSPISPPPEEVKEEKESTEEQPVIRSCTPGWKCRGQHVKGFQDSGCNWIKDERCEFGCENAECLSEPEINETVVEEEPEVKEILPTLNVGEIHEVEFNETKYNLSIYILEPERVKIKVGTKRSDWLEQGDNYTFSNDIKITVAEILFQHYGGGVKQIVYKMG